MASEDRIESLRTRHHIVDQELHSESIRPNPDPATLAALKKQKLRLKDEMTRLSR